MTIGDYLRLIRKRRLTVVLCLVIGLALGAGFVLTRTPRYSATATLYVSNTTPSGDISGAYQSQQLATSLVNSYVKIVASPRVLDPVITKLHLPLDRQALSKHINASAPLNTSLIDITVNDPSASRSAAVANAVSSQLASVIEQLETPSSGGVPPVKATVVQPAEVPSSPSSPKKKLDLGLGGLFGGFVGIAVAVLLESVDRSIGGPDQLRELTNVPTLGVIPFDSDFSKAPLVLASRPRSPASEAFRQLRTNLQFANIEHKRKSIVVTSAIPDEGKTTSACNLAIAMAQDGLKCLLVEADLRKPQLGNYMGVDSTVGLTNVLMGQVSREDAIQLWLDGLYVLPCGPIPPNPSELLGSKSMRELLSELEDRFDAVILDGCPLLPVTDAAVLAAEVGGAVLVVRAGATSRDQVRHAKEAVEAGEARVLGTVFNMARRDRATYGNDYRYYAPHMPGNVDGEDNPIGELEMGPRRATHELAALKRRSP